MIDYYQLELDDMVIALHNKDETIEKLEQQLSEAHTALKQLAGHGIITEETKAQYKDPDDWKETDIAQEYLEKWGVK